MIKFTKLNQEGMASNTERAEMSTYHMCTFLDIMQENNLGGHAKMILHAVFWNQFLAILMLKVNGFSLEQ